MSPDSGGGVVERSDSRDSPLGGDVNMKSPSSLVNGFPHETKSPFQPRDDRSPFKEEISPLAFKFEDRITGESLIPKGDPMEARLQEILRCVGGSGLNWVVTVENWVVLSQGCRKARLKLMIRVGLGC